MITREEGEYLYIAQLINEKKISVQQILKYFEAEPDKSASMVNFWLTYNPFTQSVVHYLAIEKLRIKFEKCYQIEGKQCIRKQSLKLIANGLKQIWYGVKECIIGAFQDIIQN